MPPKKKDPPAGQRSIATFFSPKPGAPKVGEAGLRGLRAGNPLPAGLAPRPAPLLAAAAGSAAHSSTAMLQDKSTPAPASKLCKPEGAADTAQAKAAAAAAAGASGGSPAPAAAKAASPKRTAAKAASPKPAAAQQQPQQQQQQQQEQQPAVKKAAASPQQAAAAAPGGAAPSGKAAVGRSVRVYWADDDAWCAAGGIFQRRPWAVK